MDTEKNKKFKKMISQDPLINTMKKKKFLLIKEMSSKRKVHKTITTIKCLLAKTMQMI